MNAAGGSKANRWRSAVRRLETGLWKAHDALLALGCADSVKVPIDRGVAIVVSKNDKGAIEARTYDARGRVVAVHYFRPDEPVSALFDY